MNGEKTDGRNILFLTTSDIARPRTGADRRSRNLQSGIDEAFDATSVYYRKSSEEGSDRGDDSISYPPAAPLALVDPRYVLRVLSLVRSREFDAVVVSAIGAGVYGMIATLVAGVPLIFDDHNVEHQLSKDQGRYLEWVVVSVLEYVLCKMSDLVVVPSQNDRSALAPWVSGDIAVLPNGFDSTEFTPEGVRKQFGRRTVLFYGNFRYKPNREAIDFIGETLAPYLAEVDPGAKIIVLGEAIERIRPVVSDLANVRPIGFVPDLPAHVRGADVVVVPIFTGSGTRLKIIESIACGTVVVSSPKGAEGWPRNWKNLRIVENEKIPETVAETLRDPSFDESERDEYQEYSWQTIGRQFSDLMSGEIQ